jgi:glutamine amidotransferase
MSRPVVGVLDYGAGNLKSVQHALEYCGADVLVVDRIGAVSRCTHLVLPGVGAMTAAMRFLEDAGLYQEVRDFAKRGDRPILGICLGMQLMATSGVEGGVMRGLDLIPGVVEALPTGSKEDWAKTPRIGWMPIKRGPHENSPHVSILGSAMPLAKYYFAHSYHLIPDDSAVVTAVVGGDPASVVAAVQHGLIYGTQFHPEKSGQLGLGVLRRFIEGAEWLGSNE